MTVRGARWPALDAEVYTLVATHPRKTAIVFAVQGGVLLRSTNGGVTRQAVVLRLDQSGD